MQANSTREIVKVRDRLDAWREAAQRAYDAAPNETPRHYAVRARNGNLVANYGALIAQLDAVIQTETQPQLIQERHDATI